MKSSQPPSLANLPNMASIPRRQNSRTDLEMATAKASKNGQSNDYEKLASYIGGAAENAIFRGFRELYAENLLYLQAEIVRREQELRAGEGEERLQSSHAALDRESGPGLQQTSRYKKILELQNALDVYCR